MLLLFRMWLPSTSFPCELHTSSITIIIFILFSNTSILSTHEVIQRIIDTTVTVHTIDNTIKYLVLD